MLNKVVRIVLRFILAIVTSFLFIVLLLIYLKIELDELADFFSNLVLEAFITLEYWVFVFSIFLLFQLFIFLRNSYRDLGFLIFAKRIFLFFVLPIAVFTVLNQLSRWYVNSESYVYVWNTNAENQNGKIQDRFSADGKQRGIHVFGNLEKVDVDALIRNNYEWVTFVPFIVQDEFDKEIDSLNGQAIQQRKDSILKEKIIIAHERNLRVFIKPHIWLNDPKGKWRSDIFPKDSKTWKNWSRNYTEHILHYAVIAEENQVEMFCIGTELAALAIAKPEYWKNLIKEIRHVYSGMLTYGANWDKEYDRITFWSDLDFIGIQAYFPLVKGKASSIENIKTGWKPHLNTMKSLYEQYDKPILFTELGYKSTLDAAENPWRWVSFSERFFTKRSYETQANGYQVFFNEVWDNHWFAGAHIWKWKTRPSFIPNSHDFSPQKKPAQNIIAKGFMGKKFGFNTY